MPQVNENMNFDEALGFSLDADVLFQFFDSLGQRCRPHRSCSKSPVRCVTVSSCPASLTATAQFKRSSQADLFLKISRPTETRHWMQRQQNRVLVTWKVVSNVTSFHIWNYVILAHFRFNRCESLQELLPGVINQIGIGHRSNLGTLIERPFFPCRFGKTVTSIFKLSQSSNETEWPVEMSQRTVAKFNTSIWIWHCFVTLYSFISWQTRNWLVSIWLLQRIDLEVLRTSWVWNGLQKAFLEAEKVAPKKRFTSWSRFKKLAFATLARHGGEERWGESRFVWAFFVGIPLYSYKGQKVTKPFSCRTSLTLARTLKRSASSEGQAQNSHDGRKWDGRKRDVQSEGNVFLVVQRWDTLKTTFSRVVAPDMIIWSTKFDGLA